MPDKDFVHLHLHTDYSLLDRAIQINPLANADPGIGMNACAMTIMGKHVRRDHFHNT